MISRVCKNKRNYRPEKTPYFGTFHAVAFFEILCRNIFFILFCIAVSLMFLIWFLFALSLWCIKFFIQRFRFVKYLFWWQILRSLLANRLWKLLQYLRRMVWININMFWVTVWFFERLVRIGFAKFYQESLQM